MDMTASMFKGGLCAYAIYSKTCVKWPLKNRHNKDLKDKWQRNEGQKYCRLLPLVHSAILLTCIKAVSIDTFDLH